MATDIDIASNALLLIGDNPISSFSEEGAGAQVAAAIYPNTYEKMLSTHPWSFAFKEQQLNRLSQTPDPLTNFQFVFQLPTDMIRLWAIFPQSNYTIVGDKLYSNITELLARYISKPPETNLPPHFIEALEYKLASDFAISITEDQGKAQYYEGKAQQAAAVARSVDSQGRPQIGIIDSPFIDVRFGGSTRFGGF